MGELERLAQEQSLPVLRMDTRHELVEASRLYAALGYEEGPSPRHELRLSCPIARSSKAGTAEDWVVGVQLEAFRRVSQCSITGDEWTPGRAPTARL